VFETRYDGDCMGNSRKEDRERIYEQMAERFNEGGDRSRINDGRWLRRPMSSQYMGLEKDESRGVPFRKRQNLNKGERHQSLNRKKAGGSGLGEKDPPKGGGSFKD